MKPELEANAGAERPARKPMILESETISKLPEPSPVRSSDLLAGESELHKRNAPLLDRIAHERDLCRNEGANDIAELLDEAGKAINEMWEQLLGYGYGVDVLHRVCGLPESERMDDICDYIEKMKGEK